MDRDNAQEEEICREYRCILADEVKDVQRRNGL
jgi:hypothetical protein